MSWPLRIFVDDEIGVCDAPSEVELLELTCQDEDEEDNEREHIPTVTTSSERKPVMSPFQL